MRWAFYNLYHALNHPNLFSGGYLSRAMRMIDALLAESSSTDSRRLTRINRRFRVLYRAHRPAVVTGIPLICCR